MFAFGHIHVENTIDGSLARNNTFLAPSEWPIEVYLWSRFDTGTRTRVL